MHDVFRYQVMHACVKGSAGSAALAASGAFAEASCELLGHAPAASPALSQIVWKLWMYLASKAASQ